MFGGEDLNSLSCSLTFLIVKPVNLDAVPLKVCVQHFRTNQKSQSARGPERLDHKAEVGQTGSLVLRQ